MLGSLVAVRGSDRPSQHQQQQRCSQQSGWLDNWLRRMRSVPKLAYWITTAVIVGGLTLGLAGPTDESIPAPYTRISSTMGWTYFLAWSLSFYPQLLINYRRKSVVGLSFDFLIYSFIGFAAYSTYCVAMLTSASVRAAYRELHGNDSDVALNDVFFAVHALAATGASIFQCFIYQRGDQTVSLLCQAVSSLIAVAAVVAAAVIHTLQARGAEDAGILWLYYMYTMSFLKLASTIVKYIPQVIMNHVTQSTKGWSIGNVLLDVVGGVLSISQSLLDCWARHDMSVLFGNPIRFSLGFYSIIFDIIFILQHYVWFPDSAHPKRTDDDEEALPRDDADASQHAALLPAGPSTSATPGADWVDART